MGSDMLQYLKHSLEKALLVFSSNSTYLFSNALMRFTFWHFHGNVRLRREKHEI